MSEEELDVKFCKYCGDIITKKDLYTCPDCGVDYHKDCIKKIGSCLKCPHKYIDPDSEVFTETEENEAPQPIKKETTNQSTSSTFDSWICPHCRKVNDNKNKYCLYCGQEKRNVKQVNAKTEYIKSRVIFISLCIIVLLVLIFLVLFFVKSYKNHMKDKVVKKQEISTTLPTNDILEDEITKEDDNYVNKNDLSDPNLPHIKMLESVTPLHVGETKPIDFGFDRGCKTYNRNVKTNDPKVRIHKKDDKWYVEGIEKGNVVLILFAETYYNGELKKERKKLIISVFN